MLDFILDFLFPPKCPICGSYTENRHGWCNKCLTNTLQPHGLPLDGEMQAVFDRGIWALGVYQGGLRNVLRQLKYQGRQELLPGLHEFVEAGLKQLAEKEIFCENVSDLNTGKGLCGKNSNTEVFPVPLHPSKLKERGFNQSQLLFQQPFQSMHIPMSTDLQRVRATLPQFGLSAEQRQQNIAGAFDLSAAADVLGKNIILTDDIMTTGATLLACGKLIRAAGAKSLMGIVAASGRK